MTIDKETLFNDFLGQNKNRKIFIGIDASIHSSQYNKFLNLFNSLNYQVILYNSNEELEKEIHNFNDIIYIILTQKDTYIENIKNDSRLFIFKQIDSPLPIIKILNSTNTINFNTQIENFILLNAYIKYIVLNPNLYIDISKLHGFGLFTFNTICKRKSIFTLKGKIVKKVFIKNKNFFGEWNALQNNMYLVRKGRTSYGFINHSRNPNCEIDTTTMNVIAKTNIKKNEELLLDYRKEPLPQAYINQFGKNYL
jgi:hypothetical protein